MLTYPMPDNVYDFQHHDDICSDDQEIAAIVPSDGRLLYGVTPVGGEVKSNSSPNGNEIRAQRRRVIKHVLQQMQDVSVLHVELSLTYVLISAMGP